MSRFAILPLSGLALAIGVNTASAQDRPWYATVDAGLSRTSNPDFAGGRLTTRRGPAFGGAIGRQLGPDWRVEAAVMYRRNPIRQVSSPGFDTRPGDMDLASLTFTVNALYDFSAFKLGPATVRPYLGLGVGRIQELDADLTSASAEREFSGSGSARQLMAGLRWDYGSPWVADAGVSLTNTERIRLAPTGGGTPVEVEYRATTLIARLGYRF